MGLVVRRTVKMEKFISKVRKLMFVEFSSPIFPFSFLSFRSFTPWRDYCAFCVFCVFACLRVLRVLRVLLSWLSAFLFGLGHSWQAKRGPDLYELLGDSRRFLSRSYVPASEILYNYMILLETIQTFNCNTTFLATGQRNVYKFKNMNSFRTSKSTRFQVTSHSMNWS